MNGYELNWGLPVIAYLFLAGLGAGALTTSASVLLRGGSGNEHFSVARYGAFIAPIPVIIGCALLVFELGSWHAGNWFQWLNLYKVINLSPMSIGTWLLTIFIGISLVYAYTFVPKAAGSGDSRAALRKMLAWICVPLGLGVAIYTGVLLGAMPARPFWNSPILAMLFLLSSISTGIALIFLVRNVLHKDTGVQAQQQQYVETEYLLASTDTLLIGLELLVLFLFIMYAHLAVGSVKAAITVILAGGQLAGMFWLWVVVIGLLVPAAIEMYLILPRLLWKKSFVSHRVLGILVPATILVGGFMLRYVIVIAGQITHPVGL